MLYVFRVGGGVIDRVLSRVDTIALYSLVLVLSLSAFALVANAAKGP